jgi:hypothetical protein
VCKLNPSSPAVNFCVCVCVLPDAIDRAPLSKRNALRLSSFATQKVYVVTQPTLAEQDTIERIVDESGFVMDAGSRVQPEHQDVCS